MHLVLDIYSRLQHITLLLALWSELFEKYIFFNVAKSSGQNMAELDYIFKFQVILGAFMKKFEMNFRKGTKLFRTIVLDCGGKLTRKSQIFVHY